MSLTGLRFTLQVDGQLPDTFAVVSFRLAHSFSQPFRLDVDVASDSFRQSAERLLEKNATLSVWQGQTPLRAISGVVASFGMLEHNGWQMRYRFTLRPPLWRAALRQNFRIFQQQDIRAISATLLAENAITGWTPDFYEDHPSREFCVQYGESDLAFLTRLWSEEGIFFFDSLPADGTEQRLTLCDNVAGLSRFPDAIAFNPNTSGVTGECISVFRYEAAVSPSSVASQDYTFKVPDWPGYYEQQAASLNGQRDQYEIFDYPGRFKDERHGRDFTRYKIEGFRCNAETASCVSNSPKLWPGVRFTLSGHPVPSLNREWQVTGSLLTGEQPQALHGSAGQGTTLENRFTVIPAERTWRPEPLPKPKVDGPQSAVVTGPPGEEIFCDEYGRVRVKFLWDRYHGGTEDSSCWIRVSQPWAGAGFGHLAIPRVGQEVIVDFLNGDPDQPVIMGRAYHEDNRPPGSLPDTRTQMTIRSKTYKGDGFNELRFEDATDQEQVYLHAQKDHVTEILHDESHTIGNNRAKKVGVDQQEDIGQDKQTKVGRDHYETIGRNSVIRVMQDQEIQVDQNRTLVVNSSERKKIFADSHDDIGGHKNILIQGVKDEQVNSKIFTRTNKYILHAGESMVIGGPGGSITIDAGGVTIKAKKLQILAPSVDIKGGGVDQVKALTAMVNEGKPFCEICAKAKKAPGHK
ncbi:type VI secretion system Vgr family protein [Klebsiella spallanzanii]|uniref:type VI secretion system Vgr family protein n=1 Tax=Klebsiella spallanzanii TaxID=2587528 RepID=UPI00115902AF|nr:type VI secretion system tip protein TssI/VgrG [Klebsiella spallanzanii]VUS79439.1 Actin cross-linking toxin VgrG1 [Klebsiella spallanzanii]